MHQFHASTPYTNHHRHHHHHHHHRAGILVQSWSPLSRVLPGKKSLPVLADIGKKYGKSEAQVALRWIVQTGARLVVREYTATTSYSFLPIAPSVSCSCLDALNTYTQQ